MMQHEQNVPTQTKNRDTVLELLRAMTIYYKQAFKGFSKAKFEHVGDETLLDSMHEYQACAQALYSILKPKLLKNPAYKEKFQELLEFDTLIKRMTEINTGDLEAFIKIIEHVHELDDKLREFAEELGYTDDRMLQEIK